MINYDKINNLISYLKKYQLIFSGSILFIFLTLIGVTIFLKNNYVNEIKKINKQRTEISKLLGRWDLIKKQQKIVEESLEKNKNFKLGFYVSKILKKHKINGSTSTINTQPLSNMDYDEVSVTARIENSNTKQMTLFIKEIEQNDIIFIKKLEITPSNNKISFEITLATIQEKAKS